MGENDVKDFFSAGCNILNNRLQLKGNKWMSAHSINFTVHLSGPGVSDVSLINMSLNTVTLVSCVMCFLAPGRFVPEWLVPTKEAES